MHLMLFSVIQTHFIHDRTHSGFIILYPKDSECNSKAMIMNETLDLILISDDTCITSMYACICVMLSYCDSIYWFDLFFKSFWLNVLYCQGIFHLLTMLEIVGLSHINTHQCHQLQLWQSLSGWRWQRQKVPQVGDLRVDEIPSQLGCAFGGFCCIKAGMKKRRIMWME